ncbi:NADH-quinone oxidoreductase subunit N [Nocardioides luteus]|uniref:NADH-quinone oxidoreductase subunit N n=1 Tax=Nocardioides luteus TaxID=1844 RepID=A0ABQ5SQS0_9ACTN|nr:NADH-quinone oxidoreductase subunit NuoN [Nocardioides luteus]MDR7313436.1 NADH-quinone oxidoreductase subunit N [Nocardioides luteus]GGR60879.1 NADH-quinone oxidoreductase subunit N [Nocardioides luteus]GLJ66502.1 NADH-quinone oxidoreductase subunit N [Nocardioides luteus]
MFESPGISYATLWPVLLVLGVACAGVMVEAFAPRAARFNAQVGLAVVGLAAALAGTVAIGSGASLGASTGEGALIVDGPGVFSQGLVLLVSLGGVALFAERRLDNGVSVFAGQAAALPGTPAERTASQRGLEHTEVYPLMMFAVGGMMLFCISGDLLMLFVALEVLSLPLYLLTGLARRRRLLSQEAALKYFLLGAFSSGFFLYGLALVYGFAGSMSLAEIGAVAEEGSSPLLLLGIGLMAVGLLFKTGAVPFHSWTPDVYQGAPTPVTAWMSAATKIAAFAAMLRLFYVAFGAEGDIWRPAIGVVAVLTMLLGASFAIVQSDVKRMLGYSAVAHTGFLLTGLLGVQDDAFGSTQAVLFYLTAYGFATLGAFAIVSLVRGPNGEVGSLDRWAGLGRTNPWVAATFAVFLLSMAGLPLTAGFIGKWGVFAAALGAGQWPVVGIAIVSSIIAVFFYVRVIMLMFFNDAREDAATVATPSYATSGVIALSAVATVALGVIPGPVLSLLVDAGGFIG